MTEKIEIDFEMTNQLKTNKVIEIIISMSKNSEMAEIKCKLVFLPENSESFEKEIEFQTTRYILELKQAHGIGKKVK